MKLKNILILALIALFVFGVVYLISSFTKNIGKTEEEVTRQDAANKLDDLYDNIIVNTAEPVKGQIEFDDTDVSTTLPDISKFAISVESTTPVFAEIFSSTEKSGKGNDGWLNEVAEAFNASAPIVNGKKVSVKIRSIPSGTATDYIISGKYIPDGFTPSNELWGKMIEASGITLKPLNQSLVGNVAGIVISKKKSQQLAKKYGAVNIKTVTEAIAANQLAFGYTDPFASSSGLNFLIALLYSYDPANILSDKARDGFTKFQKNVPFIASTTLQMREAAKSNTLDSFILEYQTYMLDSSLTSNYDFIPFGVRHDNPLYAVGTPSAVKSQILQKFAAFAKQSAYQQQANNKGFNKLNYKAEEVAPAGDVLRQAQRLWKDKKNQARPISAVFVADVSGSMEGEALNRLKESLLKGQKYLGRDNYIGLVSYSDDVTIETPIAKYDLNQQAKFIGSVNRLEAAGGTATFDAIVVSVKMLLKHQKANPGVKPVIFLLSDGETNRGYSLADISEIVKTYKIPIYTIGYNANIQALQEVSKINEAASINADSDDVVYKISNLLNVQM